MTLAERVPTRKRWVSRLEAFCHGPEFSCEGLDEFVAYESGGPKPTTPYGQRLLDAKRWMEWTINEYAALYGTWEWPGWSQLEQDFADDPKLLRMLRQRIGRHT